MLLSVDRDMVLAVCPLSVISESITYVTDSIGTQILGEIGSQPGPLRCSINDQLVRKSAKKAIERANPA